MENEIQFDQVQRPAGASSSTCSSCHSALQGSYFQLNGQVLCQRCADGVRKFFETKEGGFNRFLRATVFGIGGGLAGGAVYTGVLAVAHINFALITILIGWLAGKMVRKGSGGRGGLGYQILAVLITYGVIGLSIVLSEMFAGSLHEKSLSELVFGCVAGPVIGATQSPLSGLITLFGLLQAWRWNKPVQLNITGPHAIAPIAPSPGVPLPAQESPTPPPPPTPPSLLVSPTPPVTPPLPPPSV